VRTWLVCPRCQQPRGALYQPPAAPRAPWRCRACVGGTGAVYASQRVGRRHPLRAVLTSREQRIAVRRDARQRRRQARLFWPVRNQIPRTLGTARDQLATTLAGAMAAQPAEANRVLDVGRDVVQRLTAILGRDG
jgi:hypothetical protein